MADPTPFNAVPPGVDPRLWSTTCINEDHLAAFERALAMSDSIGDDGAQSPLSPKSPPYTPLDAPEWKHGVEKVTATSDFAPIRSRVKKRSHGKSAQNLGLTYHLIRWPLLGFFFFVISVEFSFYVMTRQVVNLFEWLVAWRGHKRVLRKQLRAARTYPEWKAAALKLDEYLGFDEWKEEPDDSYFDAALVRRVRSTLQRLRAAKDTRSLMDALAVCVRPNFAGTESVKMYSETFYGTKRLVESHIKEVALSLDYVRTATDVSLEEKRTFFRRVNRNYGCSALCLSGGASFGYYHFGVIRAFLDADLLPRVIAGTSAGGLIAALVCTHTDDELKQLIRPELADKLNALEDPATVWVRRWWETGARFSALDWARKAMIMTRGSLTFKEAYELTGRALNVSVVPSDRHSPTILLNHLTSPNCIIWSAIIASAAVPGILNPVVLMAKDRDGSIRPHNLGGSRFKDGSLREDIPLGRLHTQFNCNFSVVSQTNPHIHLFFFSSRGSVGRPVAHRKGKGWRGGFILSALESYIKLDLSKHVKVLRDLELLPHLLQSDWSGVFTQKFSGDITITPTSRVNDWFRILTDPDRKELKRMLEVGQRTTFPTLRMVQNRSFIERAILRGRMEVRLAMRHDKPTNDSTEPARSSTPLPIESDADTAIALRSRRKRTEAPPDPFHLRRRKGHGRSSEGHARVTEALDIAGLPNQTTANVESSRYPSIGDTIRNMRSASVTAFSPFRGAATNGSSTAVARPNPRNASRISISRWFGGEASSSESEDDGPPSGSDPRDAWRLDGADNNSDNSEHDNMFRQEFSPTDAHPDEIASLDGPDQDRGHAE